MLFEHQKSKQYMRAWLFCGIAGVALAYPFAAGAQTTQSSDNASTQASQDDGGIVVTAQRREQSLTEVPISVSVVTADLIEEMGVDDTRDLSYAVPGFRVDQSGIISQPTLRGISTVVSTPGNDPSVVTYIDGIYQGGGQAGLTWELPDVQQIEVLKGPQGTLFGRNAMGGALLITTQEPTDTLTGKATVGYGSFNEQIVSGSIAGPIFGDVLSGTLSAYRRSHDGYVTNLAGGEDLGGLESTVVRAKLRLRPADYVTIEGIVYYRDREDRNTVLQPLNGNTMARNFDPNVVLPTGPWQGASTPGVDPQLRNNGWGASLRAEIDFGGAVLSSSISGIDTEDYVEIEGDQTVVPVSFLYGNQLHENYVQENILRSDGNGRLSWLIGSFLYHETARFDPLVLAGSGSRDAPTNTANRTRLETDAYAFFGDAELEVTDRLTLVAGLRYSHEEKVLYGASRTLGNLPSDPLPRVGQNSWESLTPRFAIRYDLTDTTNVYLNYSEGFKSGLFQASSPLNFTADPEELQSIELGFKMVDHNYSLNAAIFQYELDGQQLPAWIGTGTSLLSRVINATTAEINGLELEGSIDVTDHFSLRGALTVLDAKYGDFPAATVQDIRTNCSPIPFPCGNFTTTADVTGNQLIRTPNWALSTTASYEREFAFGAWGFSASALFSDEIFYDVTNRVSQDPYTVVNAQTWWSPSGIDQLRFTLWGRNLTDEAVISSAYITAASDAVAYEPPRSFGVRLDYTF